MKLYASEKLFPLDGGTDESLFTPMLNALVAVGQLQQADLIPYADAVDTSWVKAAQQ